MEISENPGFMYGQNFKIFSKYVWIAAGMHRKSQILFGMLPDSQMETYCSTYSNCKFNHSVSIPPALPAVPRPFLHAATIAFTALKIS